MLNSFVQMPSGGSQSQESPRARDLADQIDQPTRPGREENTPQARNESKSRRQTLFYNASNYDALASLGVAQSQVYQVVLLGTEYVESTKIGAKPYTVRLRPLLFPCSSDSFLMITRHIAFVYHIKMEQNGLLPDDIVNFVPSWRRYGGWKGRGEMQVHSDVDVNNIINQYS